MFEDFCEPTFTDDLAVKVTNCVAGANLITVASLANFKINDCYWLSDGTNFERVKIKSVMKVATGLHVKVDKNLVNSYDLTRTFIYRTTLGLEIPNELFLTRVTSDLEVKNCAVIVRHSELIDTELSATVYLYESPQSKNITLGVGDGTNKIFTIPDANIDHESLEVYVDGVLATDYYFETGNAYVQLTATSGSTVTASYIYNSAPVEIELEEIDTFSDGETLVTRFTGASARGYKIVSVSVKLTKLTALLPDDEPKIYRLAAGFSE